MSGRRHPPTAPAHYSEDSLSPCWNKLQKTLGLDVELLVSAFLWVSSVGGFFYLQCLLIRQQLGLNQRVILLGPSEGAVVVLHQGHHPTFHPVLQLVDLRPPLSALGLGHRLHLLVISDLNFCWHGNKGRVGGTSSESDVRACFYQTTTIKRLKTSVG